MSHFGMKTHIVLGLLAVFCISREGMGAQTPSLGTERAASVSKVATGSTSMKAFLDTLPDAKVPPFNEMQALSLVAMPLSCIDHPQRTSEETPTGYLFEAAPKIIDGYDKIRAFYGCNDWHSAVNSTWTMIRLSKMFPKLSVTKLVRERLGNHLESPNIQGEVKFFHDAKGFERPYGYAWLLKVYGELSTWNDPDAQVWASNVAPLAIYLKESVTKYLKDLQFPMRSGVHQNTANCLNLMFDYAEALKDVEFRAALVETAKRLFLKDEDCQPAFEPSGSDFLSPCLVEAVTMTKALEPNEFVKWFDRYMPAPDSVKFKPLVTPVEITTKDQQPLPKSEYINDKVHLIGLSFHRAESLNRIADALPSGDPRVAVYRRLAAIHAQRGLESAVDGGYAGSHWVGTYWLLYAVTVHN